MEGWKEKRSGADTATAAVIAGGCGRALTRDSGYRRCAAGGEELFNLVAVSTNEGSVYMRWPPLSGLRAKGSKPGKKVYEATPVRTCGTCADVG
jgi:hypothetical protein